MITLQALHPSQYRQVAEWEHGPQPATTDWEQYAREMQEMKYERFGLYLLGEFVGCVSLERVGRKVAAFHVATRRHTFHPDYLAQVLLKMAGRLFERGFLACLAYGPIEKREVARLAIRCGMRELSKTA